MTGSLSKRRLWPVALACGLWMALSPFAGAQQPAPAAPDPSPVEAPGSRTVSPAAGDRAGSAVEVEELSAPDPNAAGALPVGVKPLGPGMWKTIRAADLAARLDRLPAFERSPVMQGLTARMLLSPSAGPLDGPRDGVAPWYVARLRALNARGNWAGALALADYGLMSDPVVAEAAFLARLASRPAIETCPALQAIETRHEGQFWSQLRILCQIAGGDVEGAQLALDVLKEKGVSDPSFFAAAAKSLGGKPPANMTPPDTAVQAAMWVLAALPVTLQAARSDKPEIAALARSSGDSDLVKLAGLGTLARQDANQIPNWIAAIGRAQLLPDQKDDPEETAKTLPVAAGDAVFVQAIAARTLPAAKASAFAAMLQRGQSRGEFPYAAKVLARSAADIAPLPETAWAAPEVARVLIYNGEVARAESWFKALSPSSPSDQPTINAVQIYGWLRQPNEARTATLNGALRWLVETAANPGPNRALARARLIREAPILDALGVVLPLEAASAMDEDGPGVALAIDGPALRDAMQSAADQGAAGEAILNAAILLNGQGAAAARAQTVAAVVRAFVKLGLRQEAKALALEALLGTGKRGL